MTILLTCVSNIGRQSQSCLNLGNAHFTTKGSILFTLSKNRLNLTQKCHFKTVISPLPLNSLNLNMNMGKTRSMIFPGLNLFQKVKLKFSTGNIFDINRNVIQDVIIYTNKNDAFFKTLSFVGVIQMLVWGYLAVAVQDLRVAPPQQDTSNLSLWKKILYKEGQYKNALSVLSLVMGFTILFISATYPRRAIKSLWLLKGGKDVKITTFGWMGREHTLNKPIEHINCLQARTGIGLYIPLQIKNKFFFYLVDKKGQFHNTDLFDYAIGIERKFK